ncbi:MAG: plasmid mobilization protein [Desertimonas sp.]
MSDDPLSVLVLRSFFAVPANSVLLTSRGRVGVDGKCRWHLSSVYAARYAIRYLIASRVGLVDPAALPPPSPAGRVSDVPAPVPAAADRARRDDVAGATSEDSAPLGGGAALGLSAVPAEESSPPKRLRRRTGGRGHQVKLRLDDDELERLRADAERAGMSVQRYVVEALVRAPQRTSGEAGGGVVAPAAPALTLPQQRALIETFLAVRRTLAGAANNLNQLTRWSHAHEQAAEGLEAAIAAVEVAAGKVRDSAVEISAAFDPDGEG